MRSINLLPPDAKRRGRLRGLSFLLLLLGAGYIALLVLGTLYFQGQADDAADERDVQEAINAEIRSEISALRELETLAGELETRVAVVSDVLSRDVAWGRLINDLARIIPPRVWLTSFTGAIDAPGTPTIGSIQVAGIGFDYPDVASWLRSLDSTNFPGVSQTWVSQVTLSSVGEAPVVDFASSTFLTDAALSERAADRLPVLP